MEVRIRQARVGEHDAVLHHYARCGYRGGVEGADTVFVAEDASGIVGAVRLSPEGDFWVLRGMHVLPSHQRKGVGSALLARAGAWLGAAVCYCLPYCHLTAFYQQSGFQVVEPRHVPAILRDRHANYLARGLDVVAMVRMAHE